MKFLPVSAALLGGLLSSRGEEPAPQWDVEIPAPITDGKPSAPAPKPEPIDFKVLNSRTTPKRVTEAPELPGLPPVTGTINVTVQRVADPGLPDPPPPLPALPPDDPAIITRLQELSETYRGTKMVFLSATVYDHSYTLLRIYPHGKIEGVISAWSNIDFNHFGGFSTFRVKDADGTFHDCGFMMGIGDCDTVKIRQRFAQEGSEFDEPVIPELPDLATGGPSFVVVEGAKNGEAMDTLSQIHALYAKEGQRMKEAYETRIKAYEERKAYLLANPPVPKDVSVQFWKREKSGQTGQGTSPR